MNRALGYIIALLILANFGMLLWPDKTHQAPHVYPVKEDVNPHFVRLNKEIEERFYSKPVEEVSEPSLVSDVDSSSPVEVATEGCYRVGPFMHQANYELAQAVLFNAGIDYKKSKRASKASNVYRIFLGPFEGQEQVVDARRMLRDKKVLDHFVRRQDDGAMMISLGIYSSPESADTALRLFERKLSNVNKRSENVILPDSYWLHFEETDDERLLPQLRAIDWGEPSAKMGLFTCGV